MMKNSPINELQQLMVITAEECGELVQMCSKIVRKYEYFEDIENEYRTALIEELGDVQCMIELMVDLGVVQPDELCDRIDVKRNKLKKWSTLIDE